MDLGQACCRHCRPVLLMDRLVASSNEHSPDNVWNCYVPFMGTHRVLLSPPQVQLPVQPQRPRIAITHLFMLRSGHLPPQTHLHALDSLTAGPPAGPGRRGRKFCFTSLQAAYPNEFPFCLTARFPWVLILKPCLCLTLVDVTLCTNSCTATPGLIVYGVLLSVHLTAKAVENAALLPVLSSLKPWSWHAPDFPGPLAFLGPFTITFSLSSCSLHCSFRQPRTRVPGWRLESPTFWRWNSLQLQRLESHRMPLCSGSPTCSLSLLDHLPLAAVTILLRSLSWVLRISRLVPFFWCPHTFFAPCFFCRFSAWLSASGAWGVLPKL
jgi:hypothetical protein